MSFYLIGTDYKRADIALREKIYLRRKEILSFYKEIFQEAALFSTCNRFEIYGFVKDSIRFRAPAGNWYFAEGKLKLLRHVLRVATGLESQIKGEQQILEQINSWRIGLPENLAKFWQEVYFEALDIRQQSGLNRSEYNIASFVFDDLNKNQSNFKPLKLIVIGTGKVAHALAVNRPKDFRLVFAAHKNKSRAEKLAEYAKGEVVSLKDLEQAVSEADALISATASPHYILNKEEAARIISTRERPLYIYDLAIPRDIEPAAGEIKGVVLKNLDDLTLIFEEHNKKILQKLNLAEYLIEERIKGYEERVKDWNTTKPLSHKTG